MRDFDEERRQREQLDRSFQIGGHVFTYKAAVAPEVILHWNQAVSGEIEIAGEQAWLDLFDETILAILDHDQDDAWLAVRSSQAAHPMNISDLRAVLTYLIEQATGRPTSQPSDSSSGGGATVTPLRDASSSPGEAPSTASTSGGPAA